MYEAKVRRGSQQQIQYMDQVSYTESLADQNIAQVLEYLGLMSLIWDCLTQ